MRLDDMYKEYKRSEITVVFIDDKQLNKYINIFSIAEMCPIEQDRSDKIIDGKYPCKRKKINKDKDLYIARIFSDNPKDSLDFYRGQGSRRIVNIGEEEIAIEPIPNILVQEPEFETPLLIDKNLYKEYDILNVLPYRKLSAYLCSLIDIKSKTKEIFTNEEFIKVNEFIMDTLGVDLYKYNEYFGAVLLYMPNYILRDIKISIGKSEKCILVSFYEREGKSILNGKIELVDERINGIVRLNNRIIDSTRMLIDIPYIPNKLKVRVFDESNNLIYESLSSFIRSTNIDVAIKEPTRRFKFKEDKIIDVDTISSETFKIGERNEYDVNNRFREINEERELEKLEQSRSFIYFPGGNEESKTKAKTIIRELIAKTKEECIICDPYLSAKDVIDFAIRVETRGAKIKLLSSAKFLNKKIDKKNEEKIDKEELITEGEELKNIINKLNDSNSNNKLECNVLLGRKNSPLHDRFIVIDKEVYILGSSLNEFGSRATTLFKVPKPKVLREQAKRWFKNKEQSISVDEWVKNHNEIGGK